MNPTAAGDTTDPRPAPDGRRSFLARCLAIVTGGVAALFPLAAGWGVLFAPLRRKATPSQDGEGQSVRIGPLAMVPRDGVPRQFAVSADVVDAWTRATGQRVGSVFLIRSPNAGPDQVTAFTATCPHLGCAVDFNSAADQFECPCHKSAFALNGQKLSGPSLRGLDPLKVKLVEIDGVPEIWIDFQRFRTGVAERIAVG